MTRPTRPQINIKLSDQDSILVERFRDEAATRGWGFKQAVLDALANWLENPPQKPPTQLDSLGVVMARLDAVEAKLQQETMPAFTRSTVEQLRERTSTQSLAIAQLHSGTEEQLFSLLQHEGILVQEDGKFLVKGKDKYGFSTTEEIAKALPNLLKNQYSHFSADNTGISQNTSGKTQSDKVEGLSTQELYKMAQEGDNSSLDKVFQQVKELYA